MNETATETQIDLPGLAAQVAWNMENSNAWYVVPIPNGEDQRATRQHITNGNGLTVDLHTGFYGCGVGRVDISGDYEHDMYQYKPYNATWPHISVAASRGPAVIAKEIKRRLLPKYEPLITGMREAKACADASKAAASSHIDQLLDALGGVGRRCSEQFHDGNEITLTSDTPVFGGMYPSGSEVNMKLSYVPLAKAVEICRILATVPA